MAQGNYITSLLTKEKRGEFLGWPSLLPGIDKLWSETRGTQHVAIAILDGPVDLDHEVLRGASLTTLGGNDARGDHGNTGFDHGTYIASLIFGRHGSAVEGLAPDCQGLILPVFRKPGGNGQLGCNQVELAQAIMNAVHAGVRVINVSAGMLAEDGQANQFLVQAVEHAVVSGCLIVAAVGNNGCDCVHVPAALPGVLAVGAIDDQGRPEDFSNWGRQYQEHGLLAPGVSLPGAMVGGKTASNAGTSFATAVVSGVASLLFSLLHKRGEELSRQRVWDALLRCSDPCPLDEPQECRRYLTGTLDVASAFNCLDQPDIAGVAPSSDPRNANTPKREILTMNDEETNQESSSAACSDNRSPVPVSRSTGTHATGTASPTFRSAWETDAMVTLSQCGGGGAGGGKPQLIYAIGSIGFDIPNEARRDSFIAELLADQGIASKNPNEPATMVEFLKKTEHEHWAEAVTWILNLESTPVYAIRPVGPFAKTTYAALLEFLSAQVHENAERVSLPALATGHNVSLSSGQFCPMVVPDLRGMYCWTTHDMIAALQMDNNEGSAVEDTKNFLRRIYDDFVNLGRTSEDRARNFAGTNAFITSKILQNERGKGRFFQEITVEKSLVCRPDSDCWDVKLTFFNPKDRDESRSVHRITIDVSDVIPVMIGQPRNWKIY